MSERKWIVSLDGLDRDHRPIKRVFEAFNECDANEKAHSEKREYLRIFPAHAKIGYPIVEIKTP